jgi:hypothetical protein
MKQPRPYDLAESLWNATVSFVLYIATLLVLSRVEAVGLDLQWHGHAVRLQDLAACMFGLWALCNLVGYFALRRQRPVWLLVGLAQVLAAIGLGRMQEEDWLWLTLTTAAIGLWAYAFQLSIAAATSGSLTGLSARREPPEPEPEAFCGIVPPDAEEEKD